MYTVVMVVSVRLWPLFVSIAVELHALYVVVLDVIMIILTLLL